MAGRGRPALPSATKRLRGNPGKRPLPRNEPRPRSRQRTPAAPDWLSESARPMWRELARELHGMRVLTSADYRALGLLCEALATYEDARVQVRKLGAVVKTANGNPIQNPYLAIMNRSGSDAARLLAEFGLTPSARTKVKVVEDTEVDPFAEFMRRPAPAPAGPVGVGLDETDDVVEAVH